MLLAALLHWGLTEPQVILTTPTSNLLPASHLKGTPKVLEIHSTIGVQYEIPAWVSKNEVTEMLLAALFIYLFIISLGHVTPVKCDNK